MHDIEASTLESYRIYARRYILPALGHVPIGDVKTQSLDEFYSDLRRCKARCRGQAGLVEHRRINVTGGTIEKCRTCHGRTAATRS